MEYTLQKVLARDADDKKFAGFGEWVAENAERMGVQATDQTYVDGSYELSWQEKSGAFVIEINTANDEFANEAKAKLEELGVDEIRMMGVVKKAEGEPI